MLVTIEGMDSAALYAKTYFHILIWGAPAVLGNYVLCGWLLGMQNTMKRSTISHTGLWSAIITVPAIKATSSACLTATFRTGVWTTTTNRGSG